MKMKLLTNTATVPTRGTKDSAGLDLYSSKAYRINSQCRMAISTGISIQLPEGTYGQIAPRSGLAKRHGIQVIGGVIDNDYRGEIIVMLLKTSEDSFDINPGDRIAQLIVLPCMTPSIMVVEELEDTERGSWGFGSTGK